MILGGAMISSVMIQYREHNRFKTLHEMEEQDTELDLGGLPVRRKQTIWNR